MLALPSAHREYGAEQPYIPLGLFKLRIPVVHFEWEIPETIQGLVVFVTGAAATAYLQDLFGLTFEMALAIVCVHEFLYAMQNLLGDPIIGGWITPAIPLITNYLYLYDYTYDPTTGTGDRSRLYALISLQLLLGILFLILGLTGLAAKLVDICPTSVKSGILIGAGISACIGKYGFAKAAYDDTGALTASSGAFWRFPISFSVGVGLSLFLLFSYGFSRVKYNATNGFYKLMAKSGFVPALLIAFVVGIAVGEITIPTVDTSTFFFNVGAGLKQTTSWFSLMGAGFPPADILANTVPMALVIYVISFGDIVGGTAFLEETNNFRDDEFIDVNANRTNVCCGLRNIIQAMFCPTCTMSGPLWTAMMVTVCERYKTGKENMYSIFGGAATFNIVKVTCCFIVPLMALVKPILALSMAFTLQIQSFGSFYVALAMARTPVERGVAGMTGSVIAISANPSTGLFVGIVLSLVCEYLFAPKAYREEQIALGIKNASKG